MKQPVDAAGIEQIERDMKMFCEAIGNRLAGSPGEEEAAQYTATRFRELGLTDVGILPYDFKRWLPGRSELAVLDEPGREVDCLQITHSASTLAEGIEGDLVILEPVDWRDGLRYNDLAGKIALTPVSYGESAERFAELQDSDLAALLFVDDRLHVDWPIAEGMGEKFMGLVRKPMANLSPKDAWALARDGVRRVRLTATGAVEAGTSWNVVGDLPGTDADGRIIVVSGHLDSVVVGVGADDNASGMAAILETARLLHGRGGRHTVRFIGFGAEEQLSVGSWRYVKQQAADLDRIAFVCNFDSVAAWLGRSTAMTTGTPALDDYVRSIIEDRCRFAKVIPDASPYQDDFAFATRGVPGVWFGRMTHRIALWYHHSVENNLDVCSMERIALTARAACEMLGDLAAQGDWPFPREISPALQRKIDDYVRELF